MRVGVIAVYMDYHRRGAPMRGVLQPQIGPLIAALLPPDAEVDVVNDTWEEPDWEKEYDLVFLSCLHGDFDRARQISHYWRRRGAKTVFGGNFASNYAHLFRPYFDSVVVGDPEGTVPRICEDFRRGELKPVYVSPPHEPSQVPTPKFEHLAHKQPFPISLEVTRGCPFTCEFCGLTGVGTRFHPRPVDLVVRDLREAMRVMKGRFPLHQRFRENWAVFTDNNVGGNLPYLRELCEAITPLGLHWMSCATQNVLADQAVVKMLRRSGCFALFMGVESFNPEAITDMNKIQNTAGETRDVLLRCRDAGILIVSGLILNPVVDDCGYMEEIPGHLRDSGLHIPAFIGFESPLPGTPHFHRLAAQDEPAFIPNTLLRDYTGYTLVTRPVHETLERFIETYRSLLDTVYNPRAKLRKFAQNVPRFLMKGHYDAVVADLIGNLKFPALDDPAPDRTYVGGSDTPPPEASTVPLTDEDFDTEEERRAILEPWRVTDAAGRVLPQWRTSYRIFGAKGAVTEEAKELARAPTAASKLA